MKLVNQELNAARNTVIKTAEENQDTGENERVKEALKSSKYALDSSLIQVGCNNREYT